MEYRCFGSSDLKASAIGFGTWPIGGARYGASDDASAIRAVQAALDLGITCFDTAPSYGNGHAEELLARALGARRQEAVIVTKGGLIWNEASVVLGRDSRRQHLETVLEASLRRLRTDYVDLYLIHWPDSDTPLDDVAETLESFVASGKARAIGVSNFTGAQLRALASSLRAARLVANQVSFNLFDRRWARDCFETCRELGVGVMAYGPLAHGLLAGAITRETVFDASDWRAAGVIFGQPLLTPENRPRNHDVVDRLSAVASAKGITLAQLALAWVLRHSPVTVALVGARTECEIAEAARATEVRLSDLEVAAIEEMMAHAAGMTNELPT
jgi:aryl-alcohol dehydrogenase-like predicted oxidoreductase